ncbi:hypothetical protein BN2475_40091 [Paraburkholderia ribeironis]|uniref:Uncharacterized protein n=1 Tax=Paraburkholderia ribeironis TaxID=1247936 RepID=A0A1N7RJK7_9BURK|nr:hypothetical protein BN2475_40091 [Paraburkholderia ribeironis]
MFVLLYFLLMPPLFPVLLIASLVQGAGI